MIVATQSGGLFKSTNRGADWRQVSGSSTFWFSDVQFYPANGGSIVLATAFSDTREGFRRRGSGGALMREKPGKRYCCQQTPAGRR